MDQTNTSKRQLRLGAFIMPTGHHIAAWRHPGSQADSGVNIDHCIEVAKTAERGLFDQVFVADIPGI
jgi:alkanesulfonate monooxygenase